MKKCAYCGKERPDNELVEGKIICREDDHYTRKQKVVTVTRLYCKDAPCRGNDQMAQEG